MTHHDLPKWRQQIDDLMEEFDACSEEAAKVRRALRGHRTFESAWAASRSRDHMFWLVDCLGIAPQHVFVSLGPCWCRSTATIRETLPAATVLTALLAWRPEATP